MTSPTALIIILVAACVCFSLPAASRTPGGPARYNVVWNSPSKDYTGSMPIGNGDIGLNAWVEESGDILFYIGKTDSWDDNGRLLKVGRVRISLTPRAEAPLSSFTQTLSLMDGTIYASYGEGEKKVDIRLWVDANHPVIHLDVESAKPVTALASIELWRTERFTLPSLEVSDPMWGAKTADGKPVQVVVEPDSLLTHQHGRIGWFHHNVKSVGPEMSAKIQGLEGLKRPDPLLHRTFGAMITTGGAETVDNTHLRSPASQRHHFKIIVLTKHPASPKEWLTAVEGITAKVQKIPDLTLRRNHEKWWQDFWSRSWIDVSENGGPDDETSDAFVVSRGYALQRFINACAGRGSYPIKFNGSIFTVPFPGKPGDADYRQWGPGYWWQNTRLPYISMCASGDYDLLQPLFRMYGKDLMPLFKYRTRLYLNHGGIYIPECIFFWGEVFSETYGWTPFEKRTDKLQESRWHKWEWVSGLELAWMMMDYYEYSLDEKFLRDVALPTAGEVLAFFDKHYGVDATWKLVMTPAQACETWWECTNPMPELSGLHALTQRLLSLPEKKTSAEERKFWATLETKLPTLPTRMMDGKRMLAPAERFDKKNNVENPELYAVFPFRLVAFDKANCDFGIEAFKYRWDRGNFGWRQDDIFAAYLGLADTACDYIVKRARAKNADSRFPAFWGPNYDWVPDQDHGSVLLKTLQAMIMQTAGRKIYLFPSWPSKWNVRFKLHAPYNTVVEGRFEEGKATVTRVTPEARKDDIIFVSGN